MITNFKMYYDNDGNAIYDVTYNQYGYKTNKRRIYKRFNDSNLPKSVQKFVSENISKVKYNVPHTVISIKL